MHFAYPLPPWAFVLLVAVAVLVGAMTYGLGRPAGILRSRSDRPVLLAGLRASALLLLLLVLFRPLVVADQRTPRDGRTVEDLGTYGPVLDPPLLQINQERVLHWLMQGAQPSDTARSLLSKLGIMAAYTEAQKARKAAKSE